MARKKVKRSNPSCAASTTAKRTRPFKLNKWSEIGMKHALEACRSGQYTINQAALAWQVPRTTLQDRFKGIVSGFKHASGRKPMISEQAEEELSHILCDLCSRGFPLSAKMVRDVAFQYATDHHIPGFSSKKGTAGYEWMHGFMKRHPSLSMKKPEPLSAARAIGVNRPVIDAWFEKLQKFMISLGIKDRPGNLWNVDETGVQDYFVPKRVVAQSGKPCYQVTAGEKGETTTVVACFNALGTYTPVMTIFKGKRCKSEWLDNAPAGTLIRMSDNGWINTELFLEWGKMFLNQLPINDNTPHLLLLDGHGSHTFNLQFLNLMKQHNPRVEVWCFPPHSTHILQPADVSLFRSLKHHWNETGLKATREHGGKKLGKSDFFKVFTPAWNKAKSVENAQSGFRKTGLCPYNRSAIEDRVFAPSSTTDVEMRCSPGHNEVSDAVLSVPASPSASLEELIIDIPELETAPPGTEFIIQITEKGLSCLVSLIIL